MRTLICIMAFLPLWVMGKTKQDKEKPFWIAGYFKEMPNSYIEVVSAFDYDLQTAKSKAVKEVIGRRSLATGAEASVSIKNNEVAVVSNHNLIVKARIVDEYIHHTVNGYRAYLLVQTAKNPTFSYEPVTLSDEYGFSARVFVPGMAQIYKGSKGKGAAIIATEAMAVAGIIVCENQRATYAKKMKEQPMFIKEYNSKADNWCNGRNISIGVAAGIWVYNIIDGAVAKGKKRVKVGPAPKSGGLSVVPFATFDTVGMSLAYQF